MKRQSAALLDTVSVPVLLVDDTGKIVFANRSAVALTGVPADGSENGSLFDYVLTEDPRLVLDCLAGATDRAVIERVRIHHKGSQAVQARLDIERQGEKGEHPYTVTLRDVASLRVPADDYRAMFAQLDYAVRGANIGIFEVDVASQTSIVSDTWKLLMGLDPEKEIDFQAEWINRVHPEDLALTQKSDAECIATPDRRTLTEYRIRKPSGTGWQWMMSDAVGTDRDRHGRATKIVGFQTEITDRKIAEEDLRRSEQQLRSAIEESPIGKGVVNLEGEYVHTNAALCQFLGYTRDELVGRRASEIIHPDDLAEDVRQAISALSGKQSIYSLEKRYIRKDDAIVWGMVTVRLVRDVLGEPRHFITQVFDITERRLLEDMKKEFVATVSHELRTPVTSILAATDLLAGEMPADMPDTVHRLLSIMSSNAERLSALINDVLTMQKLSSGEMVVALQSVDLKELVTKAAELNQPYIDKFNVSYSLKLPEDRTFCQADPARFQQIAANLISNAAKFSNAGGCIELTVEEAQEHVRFTVRDDGPGLSEHQQSYIFEPFSQFGSPTAASHIGTGLGLSITKKLVEIQGGSISVRSVPGQGSVFSVCFSRSAASSQRECQ